MLRMYLQSAFGGGGAPIDWFGRAKVVDVRDPTFNSVRQKASWWKALAAMVAAIIVGEGGLTSMPFVVGGIVERYHLTEGLAGIITSIQFAAQAGVAIALALIVHKINCRQVALVAGLAIVAGHLIAILSPNWMVFLIGRVAAGLGEGAAISVASAVAARTKNPQRTFSYLAVALVSNAVILYAMVPLLSAQFASISVFIVLLALGIVAFPFLFWMPEAFQDQDRSGEPDKAVWNPFPWILVGIGCLFVGGNMLWAYTERIGVSIGMDVGAIGAALMITVVCAGTGPLIADFSAKRWGNQSPIFIGVATLGFGLILLATASFQLSFVAGSVIANVSFMFLMPYYQALTAFIDPTGRLAVGAVVVRTLGTAAAPFVGGSILLINGGYLGVGVVAVVLVTVSFFMVVHVARKADVAIAATLVR